MIAVNEFLTNSCNSYPGKTAIIFNDRHYTYQELHHYACNLAAFLISRGLEKGDRVGIYLPNSPELAIAIFGVLQANGCIVIINPSVKEKKLQHILNNSGAKFIIADNRLRNVINHVLDGLATQPQLIFYNSDKKTDYSFEGIINTNCNLTLPKPIDIDLAAIIYTSGSTGDPKGVTMTHHNMVAAANSITTYLEKHANDIILNMLPLSFDYGLYQLLMSVKLGATLVLERGFGYPYQVIKLIKKYEITGLPCVPTMMAMLLEIENLADEKLNSVRYITNTGASLPSHYIPKLRRAFPKAAIYSMYGLTECKRVSYLPPDMLEKKPDSVGIPMPNTEVWIVDKNGKELPRGEIGELVVRGAHVMQEYWQDPENTTLRLKPGKHPWEKVLHTGDLFKMDDEGFLYFIGRQDDIIKCRGEKISPREIENVLHAMDEVLIARVTGTPHEVFGEAICAEIVLKKGFSLDEKNVKAFCKRNLEEYMVPQIIRFVEELPISESGKIKRTNK